MLQLIVQALLKPLTFTVTLLGQDDSLPHRLWTLSTPWKNFASASAFAFEDFSVVNFWCTHLGRKKTPLFYVVMLKDFMLRNLGKKKKNKTFVLYQPSYEEEDLCLNSPVLTLKICDEERRFMLPCKCLPELLFEELWKIKPTHLTLIFCLLR